MNAISVWAYDSPPRVCCLHTGRKCLINRAAKGLFQRAFKQMNSEMLMAVLKHGAQSFTYKLDIFMGGYLKIGSIVTKNLRWLLLFYNSVRTNTEPLETRAFVNIALKRFQYITNNRSGVLCTSASCACGHVPLRHHWFTLLDYNNQNKRECICLPVCPCVSSSLKQNM